jgi:hypothetical protein
VINTRKLKGILILAAILAVSFSMFGRPQAASAVNPTTINFQGKVVNANGTNVTDGTYSFTFKLYSLASGGVAIWGETQTTVSVLSGVFQVNLGSTCSLFITQTCSTFSNTALDFNADPALYLGITFNGDAAGEMTPRPQLQSVPYAFNADKVGGLTAAQLVQLSPAGAQTGFININGGNTLINNTGTGNTIIGGSSGTVGVGGASAGAITLQSAVAINLTAAANSTLNFGANTLGITSSTLTVAPITGVLTLGGTTPTVTATSGVNLIVQSQGTGTLVLGTGSTGILSLTSATNTIQRTAVGTTTLDLNDAGNTTLVIKNSGSGVANLDLYGGDLQTGSVPVTRLDNAGNLTNIGTYSASIAATNGQSLATITNSTTGANLLNVRNIAPNFGAAVAAGAFVNKNSYFGEEFNSTRTGACSSTATRNSFAARGDTGGALSVACAPNATVPSAGSISFSTVIAGAVTLPTGSACSSNFAAGCGGSVPSGVYGQERISAAGANGVNDTVASLEYIGTNSAATISQMWTANNLPVFTAKVKPSLVNSGSNARFFVGMGDKAVASGAFPANGIFFTNCTATGTPACTNTTWQGVVTTTAGGVVGTVNCTAGAETGTINTANFNYLRFEVRANNDIHFFVDTNTATGISETECGTGVTGTGPAATGLTLMLESAFMANAATTENLDVDFVRVWQDDPVDPGLTIDSSAPSATAPATTDTGQEATVTPVATTSGLSGEGTTPDSSPVPSTAPAALTSDTTGKPQPVTATASGFQLLDTAGKPLISFAQDGTANFIGALNVASATTTGGLSVGGDINVAGLSIFQKLATFIGKTIFRQDVQFDGHITVAADSAGYATLRKTETTVHIKFKVAYDNAPVVSANTVDGQFIPTTVSNITPTGFDLNVATPGVQDMKFSWTAVGVNDPQTAVNLLPATTPPTPTQATP